MEFEFNEDGTVDSEGIDPREPEESKPAAQPQYSLRTLLLLVVPVAISALMFRWVKERNLETIVIRAFILGTVLSTTMIFTLGLLSMLLGGRQELEDQFVWRWLKTAFFTILYSGFGLAFFVALLLLLVRQERN